MRKFLTLISLLLLFLLTACEDSTNSLVPSNYSVNESSNQKSYNNMKYRFTMVYPSDWTVMEPVVEPNVVVGFISPADSESDKFKENVTVTIEDISNSSMSLDEIVNKNLDNNKKVFHEYTVLSIEDVEIKNIKAKKVLSKMVESGFNVKNEMYYFTNNKHVYVLQYMAEENKFNEYVNKAEQTIFSFQITN